MSSTRKSNEERRQLNNNRTFDYTFYSGAYVSNNECRNDRTLGGNQVSRGQSIIDYDNQLRGLSSIPYKMGSDSHQPVRHLPRCSSSTTPIYEERLSHQIEYDTSNKNAPFRYASKF